MADETYVIDVEMNAVNHLNPGVSEAEKEVQSFTATVSSSEERLRRATAQEYRLKLSALDRATGVLRGIGSRARELAARPYRLTVRVLDFATRPLRAIWRAATSLTGLLAGGAGLWGGVVWPIKLADRLTTAKIGFETMLGSAKKASDFMKQVQNFAIATPFHQADVISNAQGLLTRGVAQKNIIPYLREIGNVTAAMGTGNSGIQSIMVALTQMKSAGVVHAQDMMQLTSAGVPAWRYLAQAMGKTVTQVRNLSQQGLIKANYAIGAIMKGLHEFDGMMNKTANKTLSGLMSQILDTFNVNVFTAWGQGLQQGALPGLKMINNWFSNNKQVVKQWGNMLREAGHTIATWVVKRVQWLQRSMTFLVNSREWQQATTLGAKIGLVWQDIVVTPFDNWWNSSGKSAVVNRARAIGSAMGQFIGGGIMAALGMASPTSQATTTTTKTVTVHSYQYRHFPEFGLGHVKMTQKHMSDGNSAFVEAGTTAGSAFLKGFLKSFDTQKILDKLLSTFQHGMTAPLRHPFSLGAWGTAGLTFLAGNFVTMGLMGWLSKVVLGGGFNLLKGAGGSLFKSLFGRGSAAKQAEDMAKAAGGGGGGSQIERNMTRMMQGPAPEEAAAKSASSGGSFLSDILAGRGWMTDIKLLAGGVATAGALGYGAYRWLHHPSLSPASGQSVSAAPAGTGAPLGMSPTFINNYSIQTATDGKDVADQIKKNAGDINNALQTELGRALQHHWHNIPK